MAAELEVSTSIANSDATQNGKKSKTEKLKDKKKKQKLNKQLRRQQEVRPNGTAAAPQKGDDDEDIIIEYVSAPVDFGTADEDEGKQDGAAEEEEEGHSGLGLGFGGLGFTKAAEAPKEDPFADFKKVFEKFATAEEVTGAVAQEEDDEEAAAQERVKEESKATTSDQDSDDEGQAGKNKLSKKQRKQQTQMKIAELKQICERPEVVEVWDVTAPDPPTLVFLKAYRGSVPVPRHWSQKRKYLQGKRGIEKPAFKLPKFIEDTGIAEMRNSYQEKEEAKKLKQKQREKMAPKMGRMDIDYVVLHEAFFKKQVPPPLTGVGELYYEGKEFEARLNNVKPGVLSETAREALGMTDGAPPPWLINMQRYGPPPSYSGLKIPGLNAPLPPGAGYGYHPGGWGKPPVDEDGAPLYGDAFGVYSHLADSDDEVEREQHWGELEAAAEVEDESEEESEELDDDDMADGIASGLASGITTGMASGIASSLPSGIETPEVVNLRKDTEGPRQLYTVLEQKQVSVGTGNIMGTDHVYVVPGMDKKKKPDFLKGINADVEVTLDPEELEGLDQEGVKALYEARLAEARAGNRPEDFSDMVAAKAAQQKRKNQQKQDAKSAKKAKTETFKF